MSQQIDAKLLALKKTLIDGMISYMGKDENDENFDPEFDAGYTQINVDECEQILTDFLSNILATPTDGKNHFIMELVKNTILKLNSLNNKCDDGLIETGQREEICELIDLAVQQAGLDTKGNDITEEWREW